MWSLIEHAQHRAELPPPLKRWVEDAPSNLVKRLRKHRLIDSLPERIGFIAFLETHFEQRQRSDRVKPGTVEVWRRSIAMARKWFRTDPPIRDLKAEDLIRFRDFALRQKGRTGALMSEQTVRKYCGVLKQGLAAAVEQGHASQMPWPAKVPTSASRNEQNERYVSHEEFRRLIGATGCPEERLLLGLSRLAGVRVPSEIREMKWTDLSKDPDRGAAILAIHATKTAVAGGFRTRSTPVCPELEELIDAQRSSTDSEFMLPRLRTSTNLHPLVRRLRAKAGLKPWPRATHNLRASCVTDLLKRFPEERVCVWMGHSATVQQRHYLRDDGDHSLDFAAAEQLRESGFGKAAPRPCPRSDGGRADGG